MLRVADQRSRQEACSQAPAARLPPRQFTAQPKHLGTGRLKILASANALAFLTVTPHAGRHFLNCKCLGERLGWPWHFRLRQHFQTLFNGRQLSLGVGADFHLPRARPLNSGYGCSRGRVRRERAVAYEAEPSQRERQRRGRSAVRRAPAKR